MKKYMTLTHIALLASVVTNAFVGTTDMTRLYGLTILVSGALFIKAVFELDKN